jgi:hypothetical protein
MGKPGLLNVAAKCVLAMAKPTALEIPTKTQLKQQVHKLVERYPDPMDRYKLQCRPWHELQGGQEYFECVRPVTRWNIKFF